MQIALSTALPMLQFPKHIILFFSCFIISFEAFAQEKYRAVNWGVNDGLSMAGKNYVLKDARGFLWVSSISGINRFDGKSFKNYFGEKNKPGALLGGFTAFPLIEDSIHNIWIGTNDGLSRYDIIADTFSNFKLYPDSYQELRHSYPFQATKNEVYAIHIYSKTIYTFNIHTLAKRALIKLVPTDTVDFGNKVEPGIIYDEKSNSLWMLQGGVDKPGGGLLQISLSTGKREHYKWPCFKKIADHPHFSQGMCFDQKRRCLWLNTRDGLMQFKLDDKQFHHIDAFNEWVKLKDYNFPGAVGGITLDQQNRVWVSTNPKGIIIYDPATQLASFPFMDQNLEKDVSSGNCSIYCDRDGLIWSSSIGYKGIYQLIPFSPAVTRYASEIFHSDIQNMLLADKGKMWVGGWSGLYSFDPVSVSITMIKRGAVDGIGSNSNFPMMIDTINQKAWIGVEPWGIDEMEIPALTYRPLIFKDMERRKIIPENINSWLVKPFQNGFLFVIQGRGIFFVNRDSLVAQQMLDFPQAIFNLVVADDKYLFLCRFRPFDNLTYIFKNGKWLKTANPLDSLGWVNIFHNKIDQTYWIGTDKELFQFNSSFQKNRSYTEKDGLPSQSWVTIVSDNSGNIWLTNPTGVISQLNTKTGQFTNLSEKDGYQKNYFGYVRPFIKDANGDLYFSGVEGIDRVSPDKFKSSPPSSVYLHFT